MTTSFEKTVAAQVASNITGVVSVVNNISYPVSWTWRSDEEIRQDIKDELFWSPYVDEEQVKVTVSMGLWSH